jgi:hypothetical protein
VNYTVKGFEDGWVTDTGTFLESVINEVSKLRWPKSKFIATYLGGFPSKIAAAALLNTCPLLAGYSLELIYL